MDVIKIWEVKAMYYFCSMTGRHVPYVTSNSTQFLVWTLKESIHQQRLDGRKRYCPLCECSVCNGIRKPPDVIINFIVGWQFLMMQFKFTAGFNWKYRCFFRGFAFYMSYEWEIKSAWDPISLSLRVQSGWFKIYLIGPMVRTSLCCIMNCIDVGGVMPSLCWTDAYPYFCFMTWCFFCFLNGGCVMWVIFILELVMLQDNDYH